MPIYKVQYMDNNTVRYFEDVNANKIVEIFTDIGKVDSVRVMIQSEPITVEPISNLINEFNVTYGAKVNLQYQYENLQSEIDRLKEEADSIYKQIQSL